MGVVSADENQCCRYGSGLPTVGISGLEFVALSGADDNRLTLKFCLDYVAVCYIGCSSMKTLVRKFIILLPAVAVWGHVFQSTVVWGQGAAPKVSVEVAPDQYTGESVVLERSDVVYSMAADGTGSAQRTVVVRVQSEAAVKE